jgi:hypothetical protein
MRWAGSGFCDQPETERNENINGGRVGRTATAGGVSSGLHPNTHI